MNVRDTVVALLIATPALASAQRQLQRWQPEARLDVIAARATAVHFAAGANVITGDYIRLGFLGGGGARRDGDSVRASGRVDVVARFHLDPFRQFKRGFYGGGGGSWLFDDGLTPRVRMLLVIGFEGPEARSTLITGAEVGVGGGVRVGVTLRRARDAAR
jgi:hypothetical protein